MVHARIQCRMHVQANDNIYHNEKAVRAWKLIILTGLPLVFFLAPRVFMGFPVFLSLSTGIASLLNSDLIWKQKIKLSHSDCG